jgi:hypothetical protein
MSRDLVLTCSCCCPGYSETLGHNENTNPRLSLYCITANRKHQDPIVEKQFQLPIRDTATGVSIMTAAMGVVGLKIKVEAERAAAGPNAVGVGNPCRASPTASRMTTSSHLHADSSEILP